MRAVFSQKMLVFSQKMPKFSIIIIILIKKAPHLIIRNNIPASLNFGEFEFWHFLTKNQHFLTKNSPH